MITSNIYSLQARRPSSYAPSELLPFIWKPIQFKDKKRGAEIFFYKTRTFSVFLLSQSLQNACAGDKVCCCCCSIFVQRFCNIRTTVEQWLCRWPPFSTQPWKATVSTEKAVRWVFIILLSWFSQRWDNNQNNFWQKWDKNQNYFDKDGITIQIWDDNGNGNLKSNSVNGEGSEVSFDYSVILILILANMG